MREIKRISYVLLLILFVGGCYYFFLHQSPTDEAYEKLKEFHRQELLKWHSQLEHARLLSYLHQYDQSVAEYRELLDLKPDSMIVRTDLATVLYYQGKFQEALDLLNGIPPGQRDDQVRQLMANIYLSLNNYSEAERLYREHLQKFPNDKEATLKLAELLSWEKNYQDSAELYRKILAEDPENIQIRRKYARILIWMGRKSEGAEELKKTLMQKNEAIPSKN